jgi:hypothetical protein
MRPIWTGKEIELAMTSRNDNAIHRISRKSRQGRYEKYDGSVL